MDRGLFWWTTAGCFGDDGGRFNRRWRTVLEGRRRPFLGATEDVLIDDGGLIWGTTEGCFGGTTEAVLIDGGGVTLHQLLL